MNQSCHTYERVMSHPWMSHVTHVNESCHTCERVMSHIWKSHVTHTNESCHTSNESYHTYEWVMSHIWMSHVTHMNESCHTHEWVMAHTWMSHVTHMNESCHAYDAPHRCWRVTWSLVHVSLSFFLRFIHIFGHAWLAISLAAVGGRVPPARPVVWGKTTRGRCCQCRRQLGVARAVGAVTLTH